jgi:FkbM family methyltransferase
MLKLIEKKVRLYRTKLLKKIFNSRRGKKRHLEGMSSDIKLITKDFGDHTITFDPFEWIGSNLYYGNGWQKDNTYDAVKLLNKYSRGLKNKIALDIGANIGTQSVYLALSKIFKKVIAIEPDLFNYKLLKKNITDNNLSNIITPFNIAIGHCNKTMTLFEDNHNRGAHSLISSNNFQKGYSVDVKDIGTFIHDSNIHIDDVGFIWIDIEGMEPEVLKTFTNTFNKLPIIYTEFSPNLYGENKKDLMLNFIHDNYSDLFIFTKKNKPKKISFNELKRIDKQVDILLMQKE